MATRRTKPKRDPSPEDRYLAVFHLSARAQTSEQWEVFIAALHRGSHLVGGSALAKPKGIKAGRLVPARAATVGGYMIIRAPSAAAARALMKLSPTHLSGGQVDLFPLIRS